MCKGVCVCVSMSLFHHVCVVVLLAYFPADLVAFCTHLFMVTRAERCAIATEQGHLAKRSVVQSTRACVCGCVVAVSGAVRGSFTDTSTTMSVGYKSPVC